MYITDPVEFRAHLAAKLPRLVAYLAEQADEIRTGNYDVERMQRLIRAGFDGMLR